MKKALFSVVNVSHWKKEEKLFVISMMLMGMFNLFIVSLMLHNY